MGLDERRNWRDICEDVVREKDSARLNGLLQELLEALEERARNVEENRRPTITDS